jgi:hypothetical protein
MRSVLLIALLLGFIPVGSGQISFFKLFTNNGYDFGYGVVQHEDSSYMVCGSSSSFTDGPSQAFMLKIDSLGNYLWSKHYGGAETETATRVLYKKNFGYFLAGFTNSYGNGAYDYYLVKTDENGIQEWEKTYGGTEWERVNDAAMTRDTGAILVGHTNSWTGGDQDIYIVRTDINGDTLWTKRIGASGDDIAHSIVQYNDSTFFIGGEYYVEDSLMTKGFIMRIIDNGTVQWFDTVGNHGVNGIYDLDVDPFFVSFVGYWVEASTQQKKIYFGLSSFDATFVPQEYEWTPNEYFREHVATYGNQNKKYITGKFKNLTSEAFGYDLVFARVNSSLWWDNSSSSLAYEGEDDSGQLIPTSDGGVLIVGYTSTLGAGGSNVFIEKIGPGDIHPVIDTNPVIESLVFVNETMISSEVRVYPNPASDFITIETNETNILDYSLCDMNGRIVKNGFVNGEGKVAVNDLQPGIYLLSMTAGLNTPATVLRIMVK